MSSRHSFHSHGTRSEQNLANDLIEEAIRMRGQEMYYIPRTLVDVDHVLGEDRLSQFKSSYKIVGYLEEIDNFGGSGGFMQKFGYYVEETATFTVGKREWAKSVGRYGQTTLPNRPCEGDLIWFPMADALFEIKYVEHQGEGVGGFYQLGKLYVYRLKCELFTFSSERFDTGIDEVDDYALSQTFDLGVAGVPDASTGDLVIPEKKEQQFDRTDVIVKEADKILNDIEHNPFAEI